MAEMNSDCKVDCKDCASKGMCSSYAQFRYNEGKKDFAELLLKQDVIDKSVVKRLLEQSIG